MCRKVDDRGADHMTAGIRWTLTSALQGHFIHHVKVIRNVGRCLSVPTGSWAGRTFTRQEGAFLFSCVSVSESTACRSSAPATVSHLSGDRKMVPFHPDRRFSSVARCRPFQRILHMPRLHYCPCSLSLGGTVAAGQSVPAVRGQPACAPPGCGASSPGKHLTPWGTPPSHLRGGPRRCIQRGSLPHPRTPPPAGERPAGGSRREVRRQSRSWRSEDGRTTQSQASGIRRPSCRRDSASGLANRGPSLLWSLGPHLPASPEQRDQWYSPISMATFSCLCSSRVFKTPGKFFIL